MFFRIYAAMRSVVLSLFTVEIPLETKAAELKAMRQIRSIGEQDKTDFVKSLLVEDYIGRNFLYNTVLIIDEQYTIEHMCTTLQQTKCFIGANVEKRIRILLEGFFSCDKNGENALLFFLNNKQFALFAKKLFESCAFSTKNYRYFFNRLKEENHFLFRKAAQTFSDYSFVRLMLIKAGYSSYDLKELLNTPFPEAFFDEQRLCTPLMMLIYETIQNPPQDYANFTSLLLQFTLDGAQLTDIQLAEINAALDALKKNDGLSPQYLELLSQWMDSLPGTVQQEHSHQRAGLSPRVCKTNLFSIKEEHPLPALDWVVDISASNAGSP